MGLTFVPAIANATTGVTDADAGVASAMVNTNQQIGGAVGTAALSTIFASALTRYLSSQRQPAPPVRAAAAIHGYTVAFGVSCALFLAGAILTALRLRGAAPGTPPESEPDSDGAASPPNPGPADWNGSAEGPPNRVVELLDRGLNREAVGIVLDLKLQIAQLESENRYLTKNLVMAARTGYVRPTPPESDLAPALHRRTERRRG